MSTWGTNEYNDNMSGTSMAAPYVTGTAALIMSINPKLKASEIKECIMNNVDPVGAFVGKCQSGGRLNAFLAVLDAGGIMRGDVDADGRITSADARLALRYSSGLETYTSRQGVLADYDMDGYITAADARTILRIAAHLE